MGGIRHERLGGRAERSGMKTRPVAAPRTKAQLARDVETALAWLRRNSSQKVRDGMARYGLPTDNALGVSVGTIQKLAKELGRDHELAVGLWETGVYEARLLVSFVGDPARLTADEMEQWCQECDNWGVVDTLCFKLFDQSPHAWKKVVPWSRQKGEFQKRAGVVLLACLAGHDQEASDAAFRRCLPAAERAASDERNFVKKGVSWALRMVGRRNAALHADALAIGERLAKSERPAERWIGRDVVRELTSAAVRKKVAAKSAA